MRIKTPKGTINWWGDNILLREAVFTQIRMIFANHNARETDTPVFELKQILTNK
jgi:histidyl-tRNA synthetase